MLNELLLSRLRKLQKLGKTHESLKFFVVSQNRREYVLEKHLAFKTLEKVKNTYELRRWLYYKSQTNLIFFRATSSLF